MSVNGYLTVINHINRDGSKSARLPKPCTYCGALGHTSMGCLKKPRKPLKATKRIRRVGKVTKKQMEFNKAWLDSIPDDKLYCFYCLHIGVKHLLTREEAQPEHFMSRARHPDLRYDPYNMVVSCQPHNKAKGSLDGFDYLKILEKEKNSARD